MPAPTLVAKYNTATWADATTPKTAAVTTAVGDLLVSYAVAEETSPALGAASGPNASFTERTASIVASRAHSKTHTGVATAAGTWNVSHVGGTSFYGFGVARISGSDGPGASFISYGTNATPANLSVTTTQDNSGLLVVGGDWSAVDGSGRVWPTLNGYTPSLANGGELAYIFVASHYTGYAAFYPDVGVAGAKNFGVITGVSMGGHHFAGLEIKGAAAVVPPPDPSPGKRANPDTFPYLLGMIPPPSAPAIILEGWGIPA